MKTEHFFKELLLPAHRLVAQNFWRVLKINMGWLGALWLASYLIPQVLNQLESLAPSQGPNIPLILILTCLDLLISFLLYLFLPRRVEEMLVNQPASLLKKMAKDSAVDLVSEQLRVASGIIVGLVMFVMPGILRLLKWTFVPFIVTTDPAYAAGNIDALQRSETLTLDILGRLALLLFAFTIGDFALYYLEQNPWNSETEAAIWAWQGVVSLISFTLQLYAVLLCFALYKTIKAREGVSP
ncbi:MAG: hypothetical protein AB7N80_16040 [Bdellovibrionales bacterium]